MNTCEPLNTDYRRLLDEAARFRTIDIRKNKKDALDCKKTINELMRTLDGHAYQYSFRQEIAKKFGYDYVGRFSEEGLATCMKGWNPFFINKDGHKVFHSYQKVFPFKNGYAVVEEHGGSEGSYNEFPITNIVLIDAAGTEIEKFQDFGGVNLARAFSKWIGNDYNTEEIEGVRRIWLKKNSRWVTPSGRVIFEKKFK